MKMREQSTPICFPMSMLYAEASLAKVFQLLENGEVLTISEEHFSLKLPELLPSKNLHFCSLKMFPDFYRMTKGKPFRSSSPHWMTWGIMSSGLCLTANILESLNQGEGFSLSDILIPDAPGKYYLSSAQVEKLLYKSSEGRKAPVSMTQTE